GVGVSRLHTGRSRSLLPVCRRTSSRPVARTTPGDGGHGRRRGTTTAAPDAHDGRTPRRAAARRTPPTGSAEPDGALSALRETCPPARVGHPGPRLLSRT